MEVEEKEREGEGGEEKETKRNERKGQDRRGSLEAEDTFLPWPSLCCRFLTVGSAGSMNVGQHPVACPSTKGLHGLSTVQTCLNITRMFSSVPPAKCIPTAASFKQCSSEPLVSQCHVTEVNRVESQLPLDLVVKCLRLGYFTERRNTQAHCCSALPLGLTGSLFISFIPGPL